MKLLSILFKLVLYVVLTFAFVVLFERGIQVVPADVVSEFHTLKSEFETAWKNR